MTTVEKISLNIPEKLLAEVDEAVARANKEETRSSFIRNAIRNELDRRKEA